MFLMCFIYYKIKKNFEFECDFGSKTELYVSLNNDH